MKQPFLKKYQPIFFKDFTIDNEFIQILKTLIDMDNLNILLIGNSGCGKTSLIEATMREYYESEKLPIHNILYINNLKDQGISYYRNEVKTFCQTPSMIPNKKKFIILDDIDYINDQSQQVFRNCIDKYSYNVNFMISCCNTQKVIESLQSRTTLLKIKNVNRENLEKIMSKIKKKEKIKINKKAERFILNICNNSIRLLINYLEKFKLIDENITIEKAIDICTNISFFDFEKYTTCVLNNDLNVAIDKINEIYEKGYSVMDILDSYFKFIKYTELIDEEKKYNIISLICKYISTFHLLHEEAIELTFFTHELSRLFQ